LRRRQPLGDITWHVFNYSALALLAFACVYPFIWVAFASLSHPDEVLAGSVYLWPRRFTLTAYEIVLGYSQLWISYANTVFYVVVGTAVNVALTMLTAYPLSRAWFRGRSVVTAIIVFTMFFSGGMIPTFLVVRAVGILNTRWAMILPGAISAWNLIMARTYLSANIPDELIEAAEMDGANDLRVLWSVVLPLSTPVVAVITLFYAVGHWNDFFSALIYLRDQSLYPQQVVLQQIVTTGTQMQMTAGRTTVERAMFAHTIKYAVIMVGTLPILTIYPFLQKYFVRGVMLGALNV
jgi:putative aldouronate transport system permease protein